MPPVALNVVDTPLHIVETPDVAVTVGTPLIVIVWVLVPTQPLAFVPVTV